MTAKRDLEADVASIRSFSRFYVRQIGLLHGGLLQGAPSLTQMHILFELANRDGLTASELGRELDVDLGYLSRILKKFESQGFITRKSSEQDSRQSILSMTKQGRAYFESYDKISRERNAEMLKALDPDQRSRTIAAMGIIQKNMGTPQGAASPIILRSLEMGDVGWITHRHGVLYQREFGWNNEFEAYVAEILSDFVKTFDPELERSWIAEQDGEVIGSVFLARQSKKVAQLRVLFVEPKARGQGLGRRLVDECVRFARLKGYQKLTLETADKLKAASILYQDVGFELVSQKQTGDFGSKHQQQNWSLNL